MKKIIFLLCAWVICSPAFPAAAQGDFTAGMAAQGFTMNAAAQSQKPAVTSPITIALAFSKLTRTKPDLTAWAMQSEAYKNAMPIEQPTVLDKEIQKLKSAFNLLNLSEPLIVETDVQLSPYSVASHGFFVQNFKTSTFFPAIYAGKYYALVPQGIAEKQWLEVNDAPTVDAINKAVAASKNGLLKMTLYLIPEYGDASTSVNIEGENYWPIVVDVKKMTLYPAEGDTALWHTFDPNAFDKTHQNILNLKQ
jgi:hypothetical protein